MQDKFIDKISNLNYSTYKKEIDNSTNVIKFESAVSKYKGYEVFVGFESNFTKREINNSENSDNYTYVTFYVKKNNNPIFYKTLFEKHTKSLKNIEKNYEIGYELFKRIIGENNATKEIEEEVEDE